MTHLTSEHSDLMTERQKVHHMVEPHHVDELFGGDSDADAIDAIAYGRDRAEGQWLSNRSGGRGIGQDRAIAAMGLVRSTVTGSATSVMFGTRATPVVSDLSQCIAAIACAKFLPHRG